MKQYKLLKDLPGLSAGTIIGYNECEQKIYVLDNIIYTDNLAAILKDIFRYNYTGWLEEIEEEPKSIYKLKEGDEYFYIGCEQTVLKGTLKTELDHMHYKGNLEVGNIFLTEEEAERELKRRKALAKIKKWIWENNIKLGKLGDFGYTIIYVKGGLFSTDIGYSEFGWADLIFLKKEDASKCLKECKDEWYILFNLK